jgi:hypothetical protein
MHQPSLHRLQRINDHRLYSNLCCQFRRVLPLAHARSAARGLAALIDGLWLRGALSGDAFDTAQAQRIAYEYMDLQLACRRVRTGITCSISRPLTPTTYALARTLWPVSNCKNSTSMALHDAGSDATFEAINPANGEVLAQVQRATKEDVERAVVSLKKARKSGPP